MLKAGGILGVGVRLTEEAGALPASAWAGLASVATVTACVVEPSGGGDAHPGANGSTPTV